MKRIILTAMALAFSLSSLAEQAQSANVDEPTLVLAEMTLIEDKNRDIMSSYKKYSQLRHKNDSLKHMQVHQQYGQFKEKKRESSNTASL